MNASGRLKYQAQANRRYFKEYEKRKQSDKGKYYPIIKGLEIVWKGCFAMVVLFIIYIILKCK